MTLRTILFAIVAVVTFAACDSGGSGELCLSVTPNESYTLSGAATTMNFAPATKTYTVQNTCGSQLTLSVEEDVRWLDVEIDAFGSSESGSLGAGASIDVDVEVVYGDDNSERLDQLAAGSYSAEIRFEDDTNGSSVTRSVNLTVL